MKFLFGEHHANLFNPYYSINRKRNLHHALYKRITVAYKRALAVLPSTHTFKGVRANAERLFFLGMERTKQVSIAHREYDFHFIFAFFKRLLQIQLVAEHQFPYVRAVYLHFQKLEAFVYDKLTIGFVHANRLF